jgi:hypothetical protein
MYNTSIVANVGMYFSLCSVDPKASIIHVTMLTKDNSTHYTMTCEKANEVGGLKPQNINKVM